MWIIVVIIAILVMVTVGSLIEEWTNRPSRSKLDTEYIKERQRDYELMATYYRLEQKLGRVPTVSEIWEAAPAWIDEYEVTG